MTSNSQSNQSSIQSTQSAQSSAQSAKSAASVARQEQIRAQAKKIMDNFFVALKNANISDNQIGVNRKKQTRKPESRKNDDSNDSFRQGMFANAPNKDIDHIVAEKKHW